MFGSEVTAFPSVSTRLYLIKWTSSDVPQIKINKFIKKIVKTMCDSMDYPPVSHKKFHILQWESQGRWSKEGDLVEYSELTTKIWSHIHMWM
jgi:hypothetical protein